MGLNQCFLRARNSEERYIARNQPIPWNHHCNILYDHTPPHFHAKYGDFEAVIAIDTGEVVEGRLPPRVLGLAQEWRECHRADLTEGWNPARERKALKRIKPLE